MTYNSWYECIRGCGRRYSIFEVVYLCEDCGGLLDVVHDIDALKITSATHWKSIFEIVLDLISGLSAVAYGEKRNGSARW